MNNLGFQSSQLERKLFSDESECYVSKNPKSQLQEWQQNQNKPKLKATQKNKNKKGMRKEKLSAKMMYKKRKGEM